eukprot:230828-Pleurochrysis_carterae.AAC.1
MEHAPADLRCPEVLPERAITSPPVSRQLEYPTKSDTGYWTQIVRNLPSMFRLGPRLSASQKMKAIFKRLLLP